MSVSDEESVDLPQALLWPVLQSSRKEGLATLRSTRSPITMHSRQLASPSRVQFQAACSPTLTSMSKLLVRPPFLSGILSTALVFRRKFLRASMSEASRVDLQQ